MAKKQQKDDGNPMTAFLKHVSLLPWYFIKFFDWLFTVFTAFIIYLLK